MPDGTIFHGDLNDLSLDEIHRIEVLKGDKAAVSYGNKGKNGVILISTQKTTSGDSGRVIWPDGEPFNGDLKDLDAYAIKSISVVKGDEVLTKNRVKSAKMIIFIETKKRVNQINLDIF